MRRINNLFISMGLIIVLTLSLSSTALAASQNTGIRNLKVHLVQDTANRLEQLIPGELLEILGGRSFLIQFINEELKDSTAEDIENITVDDVLLAVVHKLEAEIKKNLVEVIMGEVNKLVPAEILGFLGGAEVIKTAVNEELGDVTLDNIQNIRVDQKIAAVMKKLEPEIKKNLVEVIMGEVNKLVPAEILGFLGGAEVIKTAVNEELEDVTLNNIQNVQVDQKVISIMRKLEPVIKDQLVDFFMDKVREIVPDEIHAFIVDDVEEIIRKHIQNINIDNWQDFRADQFLLAINEDLQPLIKNKLQELITEKMNDIIPAEIKAFLPEDMQKNIIGQVQNLTIGSTQELLGAQLDKAISQEVQELIPEQIPLETIAPPQLAIEEKNTDVEADKVWTLMFSKSIDEATLEENILVSRDVAGIFRVPINVEAMRRMVIVQPKTEWSAGNSYFLLIKKGLKSITGESLAEQINIAFTIKEKPLLDDLLDQATDLLNQNRLLEAIEVANQAAELAPNDYRALLISGKAKMAFDPQGAANDLTKAFSLNPDYGVKAFIRAYIGSSTDDSDNEPNPLELSTYN
ncbi:MAG: Ig-like domain-containing protein [Syntrophomonadaceae bacterium]|jgi:tetratricopeptide (TPR) repeat protein